TSVDVPSPRGRRPSTSGPPCHRPHRTSHRSTSPRRPSALLRRAARPAAIVGQVRYPARSGEIALSTHTLPVITYVYAALEPHISGEIMELHHFKHHKAYVDGANTDLV